jgi:hypothetical protein
VALRENGIPEEETARATATSVVTVGLRTAAATKRPVWLEQSAQGHQSPGYAGPVRLGKDLGFHSKNNGCH